MNADLWSRIWLLCVAYPIWAVTLALVIWCLIGTVFGLCICAMGRPRSPEAQRREDEDQAAAISGRAPLETWRRSDGNWKGEL